MFLETICINQGKVLNAAAHIDRMQHTAIHLDFYHPPCLTCSACFPLHFVIQK